MALNWEYVIEVFSFPDKPKRLSRPEAAGLRHLAFEVELVVNFFKNKNIDVESILVDEYTHKRFTFIADPDNLPIEFYER